MEDPLDVISSTSSSNNCSICFIEISEEEKITLNCKHFFCNKCIQDWFDKNKYSCPLCRTDIKEYNLNNKDYRIILKESPNPAINERNRETNNLNRYLIKLNARLKCFVYTSFIVTTYVFDLYLGSLNRIETLKDKYEECNTNLTTITNNDIINIGIYDLDKHTIKQCFIPKYFYDKCFMSYNYNE